MIHHCGNPQKATLPPLRPTVALRGGNFGVIKEAMTFGAPAVRGVFKEWKHELATSGLLHADYVRTVLQRILAVAKDYSKIATNPCEKGGRLYEADRSDKLWTDDHVKRFFGESAQAPVASAHMVVRTSNECLFDDLSLSFGQTELKRRYQ